MKSQFFRFSQKPFRTFTARSGYDILGTVFLSSCFHAENCAVFIRNNPVHCRFCHDFHVCRQGISHISKNFTVHVGPEMTDTGRNEHEICRRRTAFQFVDFIGKFIAVNFPPRSAVAAIDGIYIGNQMSQFPFIHIIVQISAVVGGQREFSVGKCTGAAPAANDILPSFFRRCGSVFIQRHSFADIQSLFDN